MNVHFICRGNVLRSLLAESYLKSLKLTDVNVISSGTNVNWDDEAERTYFGYTLELLERHGIKSYAKDQPEQLVQERIDGNDVTVCMNQRVIDEANTIVKLPLDAINWNIVDIGEGHRIDKNNRQQYEEDIYREITTNVDDLVKSHRLI